MLKRLLPAALFAVSASSLAPAAHADLKVVSDVTFSGLPAMAAAQLGGGKPMETVTYYKGGNIRTETGGAVVLISGGTEGKLLTLNPTAKTYFESAPVGAAAGALASNPFASMLSFTAEGNVRRTDVKKTVLGKAASDYKIYLIIHMSMKGGDPSMAAMMPTMVINGDEWTDESMPVPSAVAANQSNMISQLFKGPMAGGLTEVSSKMAAIKGFPLLTSMTMSFKFPKDSPAANMSAMIPKQIDFNTEIKSLSEDPLSDDLFAIPTDYMKIDPPASPAFPGAPPADAAPAAAPTATPPAAPPAAAPPAATP